MKSREWKLREEPGKLEMKGSLGARTMDGNKGWGVVEITIHKESLPLKQILFTQHFSVVFR